MQSMQRAEQPAGHEALNSAHAGRLALAGFLVIQVFLGYEWLMSGLTKVWRGGFPSGLAAELTDKSEGVGGPYKTFLDNVAIPNARVFGYLIIVGELLTGLALIGAALIWLIRRNNLSRRVSIFLLVATLLGSLGGIFLSVNLHLANGAPHPWLIPASGFDQGVDLDSLLPLLHLVTAVVVVRLLLNFRSPTTRDPS